MMAKKTFFLLDDTFHELEPGNELPKGAVVVPRLPGPGERWDGRRFTLDKEDEVRLQQCDSEVHEAHAIKRAEAAFVASGFSLTAGLLWAESQATGQSLEQLAAEVLGKAQEATSREAQRRKTIAAARGIRYGTPVTPKEKKS